MKSIMLTVIGGLALSVSAFAQSDADTMEKALLGAPRQARDATTVIKWKADNTYDTLKKGTNQLVCWDRSGEPGQQPVASFCTNLGNLPRAAQNRKFDAITDKDAKKKAIDAAEADGSRVKPEYGSVWIHMGGPDKDHLRGHTTIAVPGATSQSTGLPDKGNKGGAWVMDAGTSTAHIMTPGS